MNKEASRTRHPDSALTASDSRVDEGWPPDRFNRGEDEAAFAVLVRRYTGMVMSVCRRILRHRQDAEDATQEVFLLLARKADSIRRHESVGGWLYTSAYRIALRARMKSARLACRQQSLGDMPVIAPDGDPVDLAARHEFRGLVEAELSQIPEKFRSAFVLCQLDGESCKEAAVQLDCPCGTVLSRVARARARLRSRLCPSALR
jgi:RNA polymerase sigma factor (sigma-70 family)